MADQFFNTLGQGITQIFTHPDQVINSVTGSITDGIKQIDGAVNDGLKTTLDTVGNGFKEIGKDLGQFGKDVVNTLGGGVKDVFGGVTSSLTMPLMMIGGIGLVFLMLKPK